MTVNQFDPLDLARLEERWADLKVYTVAELLWAKNENDVAHGRHVAETFNDIRRQRSAAHRHALNIGSRLPLPSCAKSLWTIPTPISPTRQSHCSSLRATGPATGSNSMTTFNNPFEGPSASLRDLPAQQSQMPQASSRSARQTVPPSPSAWRAAVQAKNLFERVRSGEITMAGAFRRLEADHATRMKFLQRRNSNA